MNITTTGKVIFWCEQDMLDEVMDYCEQYGEIDFDRETETLALILEEDWNDEWQDNGIQLVIDMHNDLPDVDILLTYNVHDHDHDRLKVFECKCKKDSVKWRDTEWFYDELADEDITYDEFEEEGHLEVSEDMFEEYVKDSKSGSAQHYSDWEYVDLD